MGKKDKAAKQAKKKLREQQHLEAIEQDKAAKEQAEHIDPDEINQMRSTILINIARKEYTSAKTSYNKLVNKYPDQKLEIQAQILYQIDASYVKSDIDNILSSFKINLANITFRGPVTNDQVLLFNVTPRVIDIIYGNWLQDQEKAKDLFEYFVTHNLPLQAMQARHNALMHAIAKYHGDSTFIDMLLNSGHLDINTLITPGTDERCRIATTPFSAALGTLNINLLKLLLEYGADPYLAAEETKQYMSTHDHNFNLRVATNLGIQNLTEDEQQEYIRLVDKIINDFFLKKLEEASAAEIIKIAQEELPEEGAQTEVVELTGPADAELRAEEARTTGVVSESKILDRYIDYKEHASENLKLPTETREEHRFDALVLRYIQTRNEALLESIDEFLSAELAGANSSDYINCLMQMNTSIDDAREVLASNPQLLHKFCTVKKQTQADAHFAGGLAEDLALQEGIYPVPNTKIFLKVSTEFLATLDGSYKEKVLTQLSNPKFIAANSCGISGIKDYGLNISKLKIARTDENLVSFTRYKDAEGNLVIEFDRLLGHKEIDKLQSKGSCTMRDDLSSMIYCSSGESSGDHDNRSDNDSTSDHSNDGVDSISLYTHPTDEVSLVGDGDGDVEGGL